MSADSSCATRMATSSTLSVTGTDGRRFAVFDDVVGNRWICWDRLSDGVEPAPGSVDGRVWSPTGRHAEWLLSFAGVPAAVLRLRR